MPSWPPRCLWTCACRPATPACRHPASFLARSKPRPWSNRKGASEPSWRYHTFLVRRLRSGINAGALLLNPAFRSVDQERSRHDCQLTGRTEAAESGKWSTPPNMQSRIPEMEYGTRLAVFWKVLSAWPSLDILPRELIIAGTQSSVPCLESVSCPSRLPSHTFPNRTHSR